MLRIPQRGNILPRIDLELTPYVQQPMELIGDSRVRWIVIVAPTQSGKTVVLQTAVADAVHQDPGPCLYLLPDEKMGRKHLKDKVIRVIESTPELACHKTERVRDISKSGIELDHMTIYPGWSGSLGSVSSFPMKRVFIDEARLMKLTVGLESNAIQLAEDRLTTYNDWGLGQGYIVSSPSVEGDLLHSQLDVPGSTVWAWAVPCPECGSLQRLTFFDNVKFNKEKGIAQCLCRVCNAVFDDADKKKSWNNNGRYIRRRLNADGKWEDDYDAPFELSERMVFWWNSEVSPFRSFKAIWGKYMETKDKLHDYKNFIQCWEADFWIDDISRTSTIKLKEHRVNYKKREVPDQVKVLCAGIDTQDDGFCLVVRGFGPRKYRALIDEDFLQCDMSTATVQDVVNLFATEVFGRIYTDRNGDPWKISLCAIDSGGHRTQEVYSAAAGFSRMLLVKGKNNQSGRWSHNKALNLYLVRTCEYLDETEDEADLQSFVLPDNVSDNYCTQFCNIRKVRELNRKTGEEKIIWKKTGRCDYRMADVHTYICLDIPTDLGLLRTRIEQAEFRSTMFTRKTAPVKKITRNRGDNAYISPEDVSQDFIGGGAGGGGWL